MGKKDRVKKPFPWKTLIFAVLTFILNLSFDRVSRQVWIVSSIFAIVVLLITLIFSDSDNRRQIIPDVLLGKGHVILGAAIGVFLGSSLAAGYDWIIWKYSEPRILEEKQAKYDLYYADIDNMACASEYFEEKGITPSLEALAKLNFPSRLLKTALGYCEYKRGNFKEARETFKSDMLHNPISDYYLGLMTYLGQGEPATQSGHDAGLELIRKAADEQVIEAQVFLFYQAIKNDNEADAELYSNDILLKRQVTNRLLSNELANLVNRPIPPFLNGRHDVFYIMYDYYLRKDEYLKCLELVDRFLSVFQQTESLDDMRYQLTIECLEANGNIPKARREIHRGVKRNNTYCLYKAAVQILYDKDGRKSVSERKIHKAEQYLKRAVAKGDYWALLELTGMYNERGDSLAAIEAEHMYSLVKMMSDVKN